MALSRVLRGGKNPKKPGQKSKPKKDKSKPSRGSGRKNRSESNSRTGKLRGERETLPHGLTPVTTPMREDREPEVSHFTESDMKEETGGSLPDRDLLPGEHLFLELPGRYRYTKYLGHGAFGEVCEAKDTEVDIKVAIKKQKGFFGHRKDAKLLLRELRILRLLTEHPNIVQLRDIICPQDATSFDHLYVVFEYVDTDLRKLLDSNQHFTDLHVQYMLYQILLGVKYMHSANIIHRDLKPANILVNANCTLKICDFGLARGLAELTDPSAEPDATPTADTGEEDGGTTEKKSVMKQHQVTRHVVTRWYRCPEVLLLEQRPGELLKAIDMWSVGCILGDLFKMIDGNHDHSRGHRRRPLFPGGQSYLTNKDPFTWSNQKDQLNVIFGVMGTPSRDEINQIRDSHAQQFLNSLDRVPRQDLREMFPSTRPEGIDLMMRLLAFLPMDRMNVEDSLAHEYLAEIRTPDHELSTENATFEFEERRIGIPELREMIVHEIATFHPEILGGIVTADDGNATGARSSRRVAGV